MQNTRIMKTYKDRRFQTSRSVSSESLLWNHIQQVCRREEVLSRRLSSSSQLLDLVSKPNYKALLSRNLDQALNSLLDVFFERNVEDLQSAVASILANIALTLAYDSYAFFQWIIRQFRTITNDTVHNFLLKSLNELLVADQKFRYFGKMMGILVGELQVLLESVDIPEHLSICVDPLLQISKSYPETFFKHFRDIVDILVGWHIDHSQSISLTMYCATALQSLRQHWQNDLEFSLTLLNQFLEDMEAYAEGIDKLHSDEANDLSDHPDALLQKSAALLRAFATVVRSIGQPLVANDGTAIPESFILDLLQRIIICAQLLGNLSLPATCAANECMQLLIAAVHWKGEEMLSETLLTYVVHGIERSNTEQRLVLALKVVIVMVQEIGSALPTWFVVGLLGPSSRLLPLKYGKNPKVVEELLALYQACLSVRNVSLLQTAYKNVLGELQFALNQLIEKMPVPSETVKIFKDDIFGEENSHTSQNKPDSNEVSPPDDDNMLKTVLFDVTVLSEIADAKNSIIGMFALSPSIFDLLHTEMEVVHRELSAFYPSIQHIVLSTFYSHCQRHKNFLSTYVGGSVTQSPVNSNSGTSSVTNMTQRNFPMIVSLISKLLVKKATPFIARKLLLHWVEEILRNLMEFREGWHVINDPILLKLLDSLTLLGTNMADDRCCTIVRCYAVVFTIVEDQNSSLSFNDSIYKTSLDFLMAHIFSTNKKLQEKCFALLAKVPLDQVERYCSSSCWHGVMQRASAFANAQITDVDKRVAMKYGKEHGPVSHPLILLNIKQHWLAKRGQMLRMVPQESNFFSQHFQLIMKRLLNGHFTNKDASRLERIFWNCHRGGQEPVSCLDTSVHRDYKFLIWWALWECASFTVSNKLRTPLGSPQDTFQKIEGALREYDQPHTITQILKSGQKGNLIPERLSFEDQIQGVMQRPQLVLQFLFSLEKLLFNAHSGCVSIVPPTKAVRTFFSTNRQTCEQWLNRLRLAAMKVSLNAGLYQSAIYHGQKILQDMKVNNNTQAAEFDSAIYMTVEALMALRSPNTISGLYKWCRDISKSQPSGTLATSTKQIWSWMKAARNQASSRYEDAIKEYEVFLNTMPQKSEEDSTKSSRSGLKAKFLSKQISNCYAMLGDWTSVTKWINDNSNASGAKDGNCYSLEYAEALSHFEDLDYKTSYEKSKSALDGIVSQDPKLNGMVKDCLLTWKWSDLLAASDLRLLQFYMSTESTDKAKHQVEKISMVAETAIKVFSNSWPINADTNFLSLFNIVNWIKEDSFTPPPVDMFKDPTWFPATERMTRFMLSDFGKVTKKINTDVVLKYLLSSCKMHRKLGNFEKCSSLFQKIATRICSVKSNGALESKTLPSLIGILDQVDGKENSQLWDVKFELSKELVAVGSKQEGIGLMAATLLDTLNAGNSDVKSASILLSLSKTLQSEWKMVGSSLAGLLGSDNCLDDQITSKFQLLLNHPKIAPAFNHFRKDEQLLSEANADLILGTLQYSATAQDPEHAKAWFVSAGWCYKWGRKILDSTSNMGSVKLTDAEKQQISDILQAHSPTAENLEIIFDSLSHVYFTGTAQQDDDIIQQQQGYQIDKSEIIKKRLLTCCNGWLQQLPQLVIDKLLRVWQKICIRPFALYQVAADSYFQFLRLSLGQQTKIYDDCTVTTTLRLLRLLAKHALELQNSLERGLKETPTTPWNGIIPQLFSRLNHPEIYVRQSISDLLCRIAKNAAHLVVYPVVVATTHADQRSRTLFRSSPQDDKDSVESLGTSTDTGNGLRNESIASDMIFKFGDGGQTDRLADEDPQTESYINACYHNVLDALVEENDSMVKDVQLLVWELRRITLLWDELWLGTLNQHHQDVSKRLHQLHDEAKRVNANHSLSKDEKNAILKEQQQAMMRPVVYSLQRVQRITSAMPETPHEQWFAENMQPLVDQAMKRLKEPPNPHNPNSCWSGFKQLHFQLTSRASKRSSQFLNLREISPKLMELNATSMPIPGVSLGENQVTIQGCSSVVTILPTKTKPKKLQFIGSNCHRFTFLFKGLEDLHLDERIMQFLSIANKLLRKHHKSSGFAARHYSVTPLGSRSGLIHWVDGATPLFTLYKKWQQRQALLNANDSAMPKPILRPSVIYYNKLNPALKKAGVDVDKVSRKDWPADVLKSVLNELIKETPHDLLQRELWCTSTSATKLWDVQQKYACSTAVMSMIGYVIGLGDRHLDNVLIDLESGEVVHIDYNVCFDKGMQLRVPEKVPFRLTPNVKSALGLTSVEGVFRYVCEQVISTLRKGRETLLTLLEAFVYDPLVDWTGTIEGGYAGAVYGGGGQGDAAPLSKLSKHDMEREISRSLFSSRVAEMKQSWLENRDELEYSVRGCIDELNKYKTFFASHVNIKDKINSIHEIKNLVKSAQSNSHHPIRSLKERWTQHESQAAKREEAIRNLQDKIHLCESNVQKYKVFLAMLQTPELAGLLGEVSSPLHLGEPIYQSATTFLNAAGQAAMVTQAQGTEKNLVSFSEQCRLAQHSCIETLTTFAAVAAHFPPTAVITNHADARWGSQLAELAENFTEEKCQSIHNVIKKQLSRDVKISQVRMAATKDATLQQEVNDLNKLLVKLVERRNGQLASQTQDWATLENNVAVARDCVIQYVQENGMLGMETVLSILTLALIALSQRGITMERTASTAGHRLVDMTSPDGDWFLEEICGLFGNVIQLLHVGNQVFTAMEIVPSVSLERVQAVYSVDSCFRNLMDLYNNFRNIILPEAVKLLQCEEPSVIEMVNDFNALVQREKLDDMAKQLTSVLKNSSEIANCTEVLAGINQIEKQYSALLHDGRQQEQRLLAGQMLLQGFDGLFHATHSGFLDLIAIHSKLIDMANPQWITNVDILQRPEVLQKLKGDTTTKLTILQSLLFVKQIQSMHDFFVLCQSNARSFVIDRTAASGSHFTSSKTLYSEERLMKPVKHFIAHFVQDLMIGIPTQLTGLVVCDYVSIIGVDIDAEVSGPTKRPTLSVEDACKKVIDEKYSQVSLSKQKMLIYQFNKIWKDFDMAQRLDSNITAVRASLQRSKLQHTRFQWLHEDILCETASVNFNLPRRTDVLIDLRKRTCSMQQLVGVLQQVQDTATNQNKSILQRLKWAAGANPSLQAVLQDVEKSMQNRNTVMVSEMSLSQKVADLCQTAVTFEESRIYVKNGVSGNKGEGENGLAKQCMESLKVCQEICREMNNSTVRISPLENTLVKILLTSCKRNNLSDDWLSKCVDILNSNATQLKQTRQQDESKMLSVKTKLLGITKSTKKIMATQNRLMSDIKSLLKSLAKDDKVEAQSENASIVRRFLEDYHAFGGRLNDAINSLVQSCEGSVVPDPDPLMQRLQDVSTSVSSIYNRLLSLGSVVPDERDSPSVPSSVNDDGPKGKSVSEQDDEKSINGTARPGSLAVQNSKMAVKKKQDPRTGKAIQERNCFAVSVWRQVKAKLDGRDVDFSRRMQISEQVEYVINEATSVDNLALMYEGWTAWV